MKTGAPRDAAQAAEALEAYFLRRVLAEVKTTGGMAQGVGGDTFNEMFNEAIADQMAKAGGVGMAKQIVAQLEDGAGMATRPQAPGLDGLDGSPSSGRALPGGAGLPGGSSLRAAMNAGIPLTETPAVARPLPMPRAAAVYAQAAQQMPPVQLTGAAQLPGDLSIRPVAGRITSRMGERVDPVDGSHSHHRGVDLAAKVGTPVHSAGPGRVVRAGEASGYGNLVVVDHGDGVETRYAHLDRIDVRVGDTLAAGQALGAAGATGRVTGPHLHFEVRKDGEALDPVAFLKQAAPVTGVTPGGGGAHGATHLPDAAQPVVTTPKESSLKSSRQWTTHSGGGK